MTSQTRTFAKPVPKKTLPPVKWGELDESVINTGLSVSELMKEFWRE